jgi:phage terminase large subunit
LIVEYLIDFVGKHGTRFSVYEIANNEITRCLFQPLPKQLLYFDAVEAYVLFGGGRGPGKTEGICWDALIAAYLVPKSRQIIFRRTMGELKSTIVDRFRQMPEGLRGKLIGEMSYERVELPNGSIIRFASARSEEDTRKMLSGEFLRVHFDEWSEWPYSQWKFISGSVRTTAQKDILGRPVVAQVKGATNPGGICGDVLNHLFGCDIEKSCPIGEDPEAYDSSQYRFIKTLVDDNPAYSADTPAGAAYRRMLLSMPRKIRDAWLYGKWSGFEGQYFDCFERELTEIPHDVIVRMMAKQYWQPIWIAYDWGKTHHSYVTWNTFIELPMEAGLAKKFAVTFRELLIKGVSEIAVAGEICAMTPENERKRVDMIYGAPDTFGGDLLSRARRMGDVFTVNSLPRPMPAFNKRVDGWTLMYTLLDSYVHGEAGENAPKNTLKNGWTKFCSDWLISEQCPRLFEALGWAMASKKPGKDGDVDDEGDSPNLDILDGARYGIASRIQPEEKPFKEILREQISALPVEGSSRYIRGLQLAAEEKKSSPPFYSTTRRFKGRRH